MPNEIISWPKIFLWQTWDENKHKIGEMILFYILAVMNQNRILNVLVAWYFQLQTKHIKIQAFKNVKFRSDFIIANIICISFHWCCVYFYLMITTEDWGILKYCILRHEYTGLPIYKSEISLCASCQIGSVNRKFVC